MFPLGGTVSHIYNVTLYVDVFRLGGFLQKCLALTYLGKARIVLLHIRFISTSSAATNSIAITQLINLFSLIVCKLCSWPEQAVQFCKGVPPLDLDVPTMVVSFSVCACWHVSWCSS